MKKNTFQKLALKKEIVARLDKRAMKQAAGGGEITNLVRITDGDCPTNLCNSDFAACYPTYTCVCN